MITVPISASNPYDVYIGAGLLNTIGPWLQNNRATCKICIVSDSNVWPLYGAGLKEHLVTHGYSVVSYVFPAGESSKNGNTYLELLDCLAEHQLTRSDCLIALGGGVVGDLTGFAAATYLRGIDYIQAPTTLLAAVDSSVGGKTAIDLPSGKNLAGAFYQPVAVFCDTDTLRSLPTNIFRDGCAEVIKYGILFDHDLFDTLLRDGLDFPRQAVIARCVELKRNVVALDEFDRGERMKLNLGHTIGHGVERCSNYQISHGIAVAIGIAIVARSSECVDRDQILRCLERFDLPVHTEYTADALYQATLYDKKRSGDYLNLIIPRSIGCCEICATPVTELKFFIQAGL